MFWRVGSILVMLLGFSLILLGLFARDEVIPRWWDFLLYYGFAAMFIGIAFSLFGEYRQKKRQDRLRLMLRDRPSLQ